MLYGPAKQAASNEELLEALLSKRDWTEEDMAWLRLLASRTTASTAPKTAAAAAASHLQGAQQQDDTGMVSDLPHASDVPDVASASHLLHAACRLVGLPHTATQPPTSSKAELVITPHTQGITIDDAVLLAPAGLQPSATSLQLPPVASTDAASNGVHAPMLTQHAVHASPGMAVLAQLGIGRDVLAAVVAQNSYVESSEDAALCALRQDDTPLSVAGLWPHYALLNHSCMPNTRCGAQSI